MCTCHRSSASHPRGAEQLDPRTASEVGSTPCDCERAPILDRRRVLTRAAIAGTALWAAPAVVRMSSATASASGSATSSLWKWNSNPPTAADVCSNGPTGNSSRGSVTFTRTCSASPTISVTITVTSGPALSGTNARDVYILQSNTSGGCLQQTLAGVYNSANGIAITIGPTPIISGATFFSVTMVQSGGGGTDTYTTNRVNLTC